MNLYLVLLCIPLFSIFCFNTTKNRFFLIPFFLQFLYNIYAVFNPGVSDTRKILFVSLFTMMTGLWLYILWCLSRKVSPSFLLIVLYLIVIVLDFVLVSHCTHLIKQGIYL